MAFKIGAFARGFATAAVEEKKEKENEIKELVKASYLDSLQEAKELRKDRKAKREKLKELGAQLKQFGFSDAQSAGLLSMGEEGAKKLLELGQTAKINNKDFDVAAFYQVAEDSDLTLDDAINRTMGELKKPTEKQLPGFASQTTFLGGDMTKFTEGQIGQYEKSFGESYQQLKAEAAGEYEYGDLPSGTIDYSMLKLDKTEQERLQLELARKQMEKIDAEIDEMKAAGLTIPQQGSIANQIRDNLGNQIAQSFGVNITYDGRTGTVTGPEGEAEKIANAENRINQAVEVGIDRLNGDKAAQANIGSTITYLQDEWLPTVGVDIPEGSKVPTAEEIAAAEKADAEKEGVTDDTVAQPANEAEISAFLDQRFADPSYANIANTGDKRAEKARIKAEALSKLIAGGMNAQEANSLILKLTKGK